MKKLWLDTQPLIGPLPSAIETSEDWSRTANPLLQLECTRTDATGYDFPEYAPDGSLPAAIAHAAFANATGLGRSAALSLT